MGDLTKNFSRSEFACNCGCGLDDIEMELVEMLQAARDWLNRPMVVNSGVRCVKYNKAAGGKAE